MVESETKVPVDGYLLLHVLESIIFAKQTTLTTADTGYAAVLVKSIDWLGMSSDQEYCR